MKPSDKGLLAFVLLCLVALSCANGGIGGTGSVTGFGSVFVNGTEWFTDEAEITLDGEPGTEADLRIGMVVAFKGSLVGAKSVATELHFDDAVQGPVDAITVVAPTLKDLEILGRTVVLDQSSAVFDDSDPVFTFGSVTEGDVLEVSGHVDGGGVIHATWVKRLGTVEIGVTQVELEGEVSSPSISSFQLGSITVITDAETDFENVPTPPPAGLEVEVEGTLIAPDTVLASDVSIPLGLPTAISEASIEGFVTDFQGLASFRVDGQLVDASNATFDPPDPSFVANGVLVEVEGRLKGGVLLAADVRLEEPEFEIEADLASAADVDPVAGTLVLAGVELSVAPDADLLDELQDGAPLSLGELGAGDHLDVEGSVSEGIPWVNTLIRLQSLDSVRLRGPVTAAAEPSLLLEVMGVEIQSGPATDFTNEQELSVSRAEFVGALELGSIVSAEDESGVDPTGIYVAENVELED